MCLLLKHCCYICGLLSFFFPSQGEKAVRVSGWWKTNILVMLKNNNE